MRSLNTIYQALPAWNPFLATLHRLTHTSTGQKWALGMKLIMICLFFSHFLKNTHKRRCGLSLSCPSLFADSARHPDLRIGCTFENEWRQRLWHETSLCQNSFKYSNIALLEFLVIVTAVEVWALQLARKHVVLRSDNAVIMAFINRMRADIPATMDLLRQVTKTCLQFSSRPST